MFGDREMERVYELELDTGTRVLTVSYEIGPVVIDETVRLDGSQGDIFRGVPYQTIE